MGTFYARYRQKLADMLGAADWLSRPDDFR
jgi:hypothetical protein